MANDDYMQAVTRLHGIIENGLKGAMSVLSPKQIERANLASASINNAIARTIAELSFSPKVKNAVQIQISGVLRALNAEELYRVISSEALLVKSITTRVDWVSGRLDDRMIKVRPTLTNQAAEHAQWLDGITRSEINVVEDFGRQYDIETGTGSLLAVSQAPSPEQRAVYTYNAIRALREKYHITVRLGDELAMVRRLEHSMASQAYDRMMVELQPGPLRVLSVQMGDHYAGCSPDEVRKMMPEDIYGLTVLDLASMFLGFPDTLNYVDHLDLVCVGNHWRADDGNLQVLLFTHMNGHRVLTSQPAGFCRVQTAVASKALPRDILG